MSPRSSRYKSPSSLSDVPGYVDQALAIFDNEMSELQGLKSKAPDSVSSDYNKALGLLAQQRDKLAQLKAAAQSKDQKKFQQIAIGWSLDAGQALFFNDFAFGLNSDSIIAR